MANAPPRAQLLQELTMISGLEALPSKVAGGMALFFKGKEFAHFHNDHEIDLRLTAKVIKAQGLAHPPRSSFHPKRGGSSQWIEVRFYSPEEVAEVVRLVRLATEQL